VNESGQIVGARSETNLRGDTEAFLYDTVTGVHTDLHALLNGTSPGITEANGINDHGVVIGEGSAGGFIAAWVWDPNAGFTFMPALKNGDRDRNHTADINNEGVVVGWAATDGWTDWRAYIWDETRGIRDLNDLVDLPQGFILDRAASISDTGVIVGIGHWGPGWGPSVAYALFPIETSCYADCTGEGMLDVFDFLCFQDAFVSGDPYADCTGEGTLDVFDFLCFQDAFVTGCP
jgi:probable HAF family extracellular repeat protein